MQGALIQIFITIALDIKSKVIQLANIPNYVYMYMLSVHIKSDIASQTVFYACDDCSFIFAYLQ